jgi:hypothetical protein
MSPRSKFSRARPLTADLDLDLNAIAPEILHPDFRLI